MEEAREASVEQIMERVREGIRRQSQALTQSVAVPPAAGPAAAHLAVLQSTAGFDQIRFTSHRPILGRVVVLAKEALRRLLTPLLVQQASYNAANARVAAWLLDAVARQQAQHGQALEELRRLREETLALFHENQAGLGDQGRAIEALQQHVVKNQAGLGDQGRAIEALQQHVFAGQAQTLQALRERLARADRKLNRILHHLSEERPGAGQPAKVPREALEPPFDYFGFEERFRGSEAEIKERQRTYVEVFRGQAPVLDIGCGRGEFLELMREAGCAARGVDLDLDMVLRCREKGLEAVQADALAYLRGLPPSETLGGIFSAHVIEHLEPDAITDLIGVCARQLAPGAPIVFETLNPQCPAGMNHFYLDPSHVKPVHPETLRFLLESAGFREVAIAYRAPDPRAAPPETASEDWLRANCQEYAAVGKK